MATENRHYQEEIQELLDNRLSASQAEEVERHLDGCQPCKQEYETLRWTKQVSAARLRVEAPAKLRAKVLESLIAEAELPAEVDPISPPPRTPRRVKPFLYYPLAASVLVIVVLLIIYLIPRNDLPAQVAKDFMAYKMQRLSLAIRTSDPSAVERYFRNQGITYDTRVFDLNAMSYDLQGGLAYRLAGRESALFSYQGKDNQLLICQMYPGITSELPDSAKIREHNGLRFYIFHRDNLTMVFWPEGRIICVLASEANSEEVVQLAFAKAVKVDA